MAVDTKLIKTIIDTYRTMPLDRDTVMNFSSAIFSKIDNYRLRSTLVADAASDESTGTNNSEFNKDESYCHAFYRICGLPVISKDGTFYNPGYYSTIADDKKLRTRVDSNQNSAVKTIEAKRENVCSVNMQLFLQDTDKSVSYKSEMLQYPRRICTMKSNIGDAIGEQDFQIDTSDTIKKRSEEFQLPSHILRPFKCVPDLASVDKIKIPQKNLAAPFFEDSTDPDVIQHQKCYLETVCRIRLSNKSGEIVDEQLSQLKDALAQVQVDSMKIFDKVLNNPNTLEVYILSVLMNVFVAAVLDYANRINEFRNIGSRLDITKQKKTILSEKIASLEAQVWYYDAMKLFLPEEIAGTKGHSIESSNVHNGVLVSDFITLLDSSSVALTKSLSRAKSDKENMEKSIRNITEDMFYYTGEVTGIGIFDILAIMIAFWSISLDSLVSMLDNSSFDRLYNGRNHSKLKNPQVEARKNNGGPIKPLIGQDGVMKEFDGIVYNLLSLADEIIAYSNKENTK